MIQPAIIAFGMAFLMLATTIVADTVRLTSGESIFGRIVSDTSTELSIEIPNATRTIYQTRTIPKTQIKSIILDSSDFDALELYKPNDDSELPIEDYDAGIKALTNFLNTHSDSGYAPEISLRIKLLNEEKEHVLRGEVKFHKFWMKPQQKEWQQRVSEALGILQNLSVQSNKLEVQRKYLAGVIENIQKEIPPLTTKVAAMQDTVSYRTMTGQLTRPNQDKQDQQKLLAKLTDRLRDKNSELVILEGNFNSIKSQVKRAQDHYAEIVADQKRAIMEQSRVTESGPIPETNTTAAAAMPSPPPVATGAVEATAPVILPPTQPLPWYRTHWYWVAGFICLCLFALRRF